MSKNVVVAGTGALAKHVLDALLESGDFNVTIFTRAPKPALKEKGAVVKVVDYTSQASLEVALAAVQADTILSYIIDLFDQPSQATAHRNLLAAALQVPSVRRFVPAEYANDVARFPAPPSCELDKLAFREHLRREVAAAAAAADDKKKKLEYTLVCNGVFMDFFVPNGQKKYFPDGVGDGFLPLNLPCTWPAHKDRISGEAPPPPPPIIKALIPGDDPAGDKISLTLADDLARGICGGLLRQPLGAWQGEFTYFSSDRVSWEEVAAVAGRVTGWEVRREYADLAALRQRRKAAEAAADQGKDEGHGPDWALFATELNEAFGDTSEVLPNDSACFEGVQRTGFEALMRRYYGSSQ